MTAAIAFDLGNVLLPFDHFRACRNLAQLSGRSAQGIYDQLFGSKLAREFECGRITGEQFYSKLCLSLGLPPDFPEAMLKSAWCDIFRTSEPMESLVRQLRELIPLCLISNTNAWHFEYVAERYPVVSLFDLRLLSHEVGAMKPDRAIFDAARDALGDCNPMVFVDDLAENVAGSEAAGFEGIIFEDATQLQRELERLGVQI